MNVENDPSTEHPAVSEMHEDWSLISALMSGTRGMRKAGKAFLPEWPQEDGAGYKKRLSESTLLPAYAETIKALSGRVFGEPMIVGDGVPAVISEQINNIDLQGNNLQVWASKWFETALEYGLCPVLVDFPPAADVKTRAQELQSGIRPYTIIIHPMQIIGWRTKSVNGAEVFTQFRYYESVEVEDGMFATKSVQQIRVLEPTRWSTYRKNDKDEWILDDEGVNTMGMIPIVCFYTKRTGALQATPPLMELAHLNVKHWQSQSDQDNLLHVARVPILAIIAGDPEKPITIGSNAALMLPEGGDAKYVEHSGAAIDAGRQSLMDLLDDMHIAGAKLLRRQRQAQKTATQADNEEAEELSPLEMMAEHFEDALDNVLRLFAQWQNLGDGGSIEVKGNFETGTSSEFALPFLLDMADSGLLSDETLFAEAQRRGVVADEIEWEAEKVRIHDSRPKSDRAPREKPMI